MVYVLIEEKQECMVRGVNPFTNVPNWSIDGVPLGADHLIRGGAMVFPSGSNFFFRHPA